MPAEPTRPQHEALLGCGQYEAAITTRGGGSTLVVLPFAELEWGRELDDISSASVKIKGKGAIGECCDLLSEARPWKHELALLRDGVLCWCGPVTRMRLGDSSAQIDARDLSAWFQKRRLRTEARYEDVDTGTQFGNAAADALSLDSSMLLTLAGSLTGVTATREVLAEQRRIALDEMRDLAKIGLDWTVVGRVLAYGSPSSQTISPFTDDSFAEPPEVEVDGDQMGNDWSSIGERNTDSPSITGTASDAASISEFGLLDRVVQADGLLDTSSADADAAGRLALTKDPLAVVTSGTLDRSAAVSILSLLPGVLVPVQLAATCWPVAGTYRLQSISVSVDEMAVEKIDVAFAPVGEET